MEKRDYYEVLEIGKDSTEAEIKKAYRRAAQKYHPDRNPGDAEAEEKFKEAKEAYEVLSNTSKKKMYDQYGHSSNPHQNRNPNWGGGSPEDALREAMNAWARASRGNSETHYYTSDGVRFSVNGEGQKLRQRVGIPIDILMKGGEIEIPMVTTESSGPYGQVKLNRIYKKITVKPDTAVGHQELVKGENGSADSILFFIPQPIRGFDVEGIDIITHAKVDAFDQMLGNDFVIDHANGKKIKGSVPPGMAPGSTMRVTNKGLRALNGVRGDLYVVLDTTLPTLNEKQKEVLREALKKIKES